MKVEKRLKTLFLFFLIAASLWIGNADALVLEGGDCVISARYPAPQGDCDVGLVCVGGTCLKELPTGPQRAGEVIDIISRVATWVFAIFLAVSIIYILWAAFQFVTEGGDPSKVTEAKKKLMYAAIGIGIALLANGTVSVIKAILGV